MKYTIKALLMVIAITALSACGVSFEEEEVAVKDAFKTGFQEEPKKTNKENEDIQFYLPFGFEIEEQSKNNVILKNGSKKYILFYNQQEDTSSRIVYETTSQSKDAFEVNETITDDNRFGFLLVNHKSEKENNLIIGIGGVKLSTETKVRNLETEAKTLIQIANSVQTKDE
jgi:hypothetical protein